MAIDQNNPTPLYRQVAEDVRSKIASGQIKLGDQLGSQQELARNYGVSLITIKKALSELRNEGMLFSRAGKGTYITNPARRPVTRDLSKHKTIGFVLRDLRSPFFSLIVHSVEAKAFEKGYGLLLSNSSGRIEKEESQIRHFCGMGVSGLIIASITRVGHPSNAIRQAQSENFPCVMISYIEDADVSYVGTDHAYGAYLATEHLIKLGYERIGHLRGEAGNPLGELRQQGYLQALQQYGKPVKENLIFPFPLDGEWNNYQSGYIIGQSFSTLPEKPDAIFAYNDLSALGFEQAILDQGLKVPEDVAIVGFDDIERGLYAPVPLTTMHQPTAEIGALAVEVLSKKIEGSEAPLRTLLKPKLVVRESCGEVSYVTKLRPMNSGVANRKR